MVQRARGRRLDGPLTLTGNLLRLAPLVLRWPRGLSAGQDIPRIEVAAMAPIDAAWLARYRAIIGASREGPLPPCAPQVLAVGLHLRILGDARFPLPVLGMVHVRNRIDELAPIPETSTIALRAVLQGQTRTERGITIDITTEARIDDVVVWRSVLTALIRDARRAAARPAKAASPAMSSSIIHLPADLGRRYARIAGDANPIHLSALTARPFGFPRAIIHGMWTLGRALAITEAVLPPRPRVITARFVRPVFLPGAIGVSAAAPDDAGRVAVCVAPLDDGPPHLLAEVVPV